MTLVLKIVFLALFCINILLTYGVTRILRRRFLANIRKSGYICLTFDDGPDPVSTPQILKLLRQAGIKATFFLSGENVEKNPDLASQIVNEGHEIGQHGHWHIHPWKCWPFQALTDLIKGANTIRQYVCYEKPLLLRPPYGKFNFITLFYVFFTRKQLAFWDIDPKDYVPRSTDTIVKYVMERISSHTTILLHDGRYDATITTNVTVSAVSGILLEAKKQEIVFATISEALSNSRRKKPRTIEAREPGNKQQHDNYQSLPS